MADDETYPLKRCIGCGDFLLGGGNHMACCGVGPLCDTCHDTHEKCAHVIIVTTADSTIGVAPPGTALGQRLRKLRARIVARGTRLLSWDEIDHEVNTRRGEVEKCDET